jgi:hypothetical protein
VQIEVQPALNIWPSHDVELDRYRCDSETVNHFQSKARAFVQDVFDDGTVAPESDSGSIEVALFVQKSWFLKTKRALFGEFALGDFFIVAIESVDGHPSVLLAREGAGEHSPLGWDLITALPGGGIGTAKPPLGSEDEQSRGEHLKSVRVGSSEIVKSGFPDLRDGSFMWQSGIAEPDDAECCPSGGALQSRYALDRGILTIASTTRLSAQEVDRLAHKDNPTLESQKQASESGAQDEQPKSGQMYASGETHG